MGILEMIQKDESSTVYQIHLRSGAIGKKVLHRENDAVKNCSFYTDDQKICKYVSGSY
jgi:hypothetical protein